MEEDMYCLDYRYEIVEELLYLVNSEPNDQTLGKKVREFTDNLPTPTEDFSINKSKQNN